MSIESPLPKNFEVVSDFEGMQKVIHDAVVEHIANEGINDPEATARMFYQDAYEVGHEDPVGNVWFRLRLVGTDSHELKSQIETGRGQALDELHLAVA